MIYDHLSGVPQFSAEEYSGKKTKYCICIPVINEGNRIKKELRRAQNHGIDRLADLIICDGGSTDGSVDRSILKQLGVNSKLTKLGDGKQGAQLRMGFWWALKRGYEGIITIDGNNKDSIESMSLFIQKLDQGYDFIQGSRFVKGGKAVHTPLIRYISVRLIHAPIISLTAGHWFTDTTNAFRGYSRYYLLHPKVQPFRDLFQTYELLAYLSSRASQLGMTVCEVPVVREYPSAGKVPTKISFVKGNSQLMKILMCNFFRKYNPVERDR